MTQEEFKILYKQFEKEKREEEKRANDNFVSKWTAAGYEVLKSMDGIFEVGDIITNGGDTFIKIERVSPGYINLFGHDPIYAVYYGPALTKKLTPRKDGWKTTLYSTTEGLKLVKKGNE